MTSVERPTRVVIVMGTSGTGKSTVAAALSTRLGWVMQEGDNLHPQANVAKMASGIPLTDDDRWPWLARVGTWIAQAEADGTPAVITCSALKRSYRDKLRGPGVTFVHLIGDPALIAERMTQRSGHFMPPALLASQLATLEPLDADENGFTVSIEQGVDQQIAEIVAQLGG